MKCFPTELEGVLLIEPAVHGDDRGYFMESYSLERYQEFNIDSVFVQDNESCSKYGVLRGLHYQLDPWSQAKIVRATYGSVLDVVVDIRQGSPTFGKHIAVELSNENKRQLYLPRGMAHGFVVLTEMAVFNYKCDNPYRKEFERGIVYNDPDLNIDWRLPASDLKLAPKDLTHPLLRNADLCKY